MAEGIIDARQIKPAGGRDLAAAGAVGGDQRRFEVGGAPAARADVDQRADHRAHLAVQERQRARFEQDLVALAADFEPVKGADRRFCLALRVAEGRKIVPADERARGLAHRLGVEPGLDPPGAAEIEGQRPRGG